MECFLIKEHRKTEDIKGLHSCSGSSHWIQQKNGLQSAFLCSWWTTYHWLNWDIHLSLTYQPKPNVIHRENLSRYKFIKASTMNERKFLESWNTAFLSQVGWSLGGVLPRSRRRRLLCKRLWGRVHGDGQADQSVPHWWGAILLCPVRCIWQDQWQGPGPVSVQGSQMSPHGWAWSRVKAKY